MSDGHAEDGRSGVGYGVDVLDPAAPRPSRGPTRVVLVGAGGHARVVLEALQADDSIEVIGAVSSDGLGIDDLGIAMLGTDADLDAVARDHDLDAACVAIGHNPAREAAARRWSATGRPLVSAISPHAVVSPRAVIGAGTVVFPGAVVNPATRLGVGVIVNTNASVDHDGDLGDFVHVAPGCALAGGVSVGARTLVGIGARVLPGIRIGADAVVGAGAVVTADVPDGITVVGVPARASERRP